MKKDFIKIQLTRSIWIALLEQENLSEAIICYEDFQKKLKALNTSESNKEIKHSESLLIEKLKTLSEKYTKENNYTNALICHKFIFENNEKDIENIKSYIKCLEKIGQYDLELSLSKILIQKSKDGENYKILSNSYEKNQDYKNAIKYYNQYLKKINKTNLDACDYNALGCHYFNSYVKKDQNPEDAKKALEYFKKTIEKAPTTKAYLKNTIVAAMKAKDYETEKKCWKTYIEKGFASKDDEFTLSASFMRNGDIKGWAKYYGSRFKKNEPTIYPTFEKPIWTGEEDLSNSTLLVHYEQGYGDNFLMFGYMPKLTKIAKKVIYFIQNNAYELVKNNEFGVEVYSQKIINAKELNFDYHIPCMSLPIALKLDKKNISVGGGYIKPDKELVKKYKKEYFNTNKFKIGIAFEGIASNNKRDIPLKKLLELDKLENVELFCFTKDIDDKKLSCFKNNKIINIGKTFNNFAETAAAIANTDIIISSDNCILNLAGAIGKKTIGIFNYHYEFRWYDLNDKDCGWYKSVKPIVNNEYNNWDLSVSKAIDIIKDYLK